MLDFDECCDVLLLEGLDVSPAELQGGLCGRLSGGQGLDVGDLYGFIAELAEVSSLKGAAKELIDQLYNDTLTALQTQDGLIDLLLPDDDEALSDRISALGSWCRSYLSGLGQSGLSGQLELAPEVAEAMRDVAAIALVDPDGQENDDDEMSFAELVEFVRVASTLIHLGLSDLMAASPEIKH